MKAVLAAILVTLALVSASTPSTGIGYRGYTSSRSQSQGAWFSVNYAISASDLAPATTSAWLQVTFDASGLSNAYTADYYWNMGSDVSATATKLGSKSITSGSNTYTFQVYNSTTGMGAGTYYVGGTPTSSTTLGAFNVDITVVLIIDGVTQPFDAVTNPYTASYSTAPSTFAVPSARVTLTAATDIYVKVSVDTTSSTTAKVVMTYKNASMGVPVAADYATLQKYPSGSPTAGDYDTGAINLAAGTWYITPYCFSTASASINCPYDFAVGIGAEPSSARAVAVPSIIIGVAALVAAIINW